MMKKIYVYVSVLLLISMGCWSCKEPVKGCMDPNSSNYNPNAEKSDGSCAYPSQTKKVVCFYFTDSDNNTCGTFGINLLDQAKATNSSDTYFISVHPNGTDALFAAAGIDVSSAFQVSGFPDFGVGDLSGLLTLLAINSAIDAERAETAQGGIEVNYSTTADSIITTIYGKFYTNDTSTYFATAYVVESNVISPQVGISASYSHQHVLRAASGPSGIGEQINILPVSNSQSFKIRSGILKNPAWNMANVSVIAVLWRKSGTDFQYINAGD